MNIKNLNQAMLSLLLVVSILLSSCGGADYKTIDKKIEENGVETTFTDKEYSAMLDYVEKYVEQQLPETNKRYNPEVEQDMEEWNRESEAAGQVFLYIAVVSTASEEGKLSPVYQKRLKKIMNKLESLSGELIYENDSLVIDVPLVVEEISTAELDDSIP